MENKIPKVIYQTFKTKELLKEMQDIVDSWKLHNSNYEYILYDDNDGRDILCVAHKQKVELYIQQNVYLNFKSLRNFKKMVK